MPSDLKPTTRAERERWKQRLQKLLMDMPEAAASARTDREFALRLIADCDRLTAREAELEQTLLAVKVLIEKHRKRCPIAWMDSYDAQD